MYIQPRYLQLYFTFKVIMVSCTHIFQTNMTIMIENFSFTAAIKSKWYQKFIWK